MELMKAGMDAMIGPMGVRSCILLLAPVPVAELLGSGAAEHARGSAASGKASGDCPQAWERLDVD